MAHQPAQATLLQINLRSTAPVGARLTFRQKIKNVRTIQHQAHMYRLATLILFAALAVSCKDKKPGYPYLNQKLNQPAKISNAELKVLYFQRHVSSGGYHTSRTTTGNYPLSFQHIDVELGGDRVYMNANMEIAHSETRWKEVRSREERIKDCEALCQVAVLDLAKNLECDPSLIHGEWSCGGGDVNGQIPSADIVSRDKAEQGADGQTPDAPQPPH